MAGTSYTRQSTITDGNLITAAIFNNEYNQLLNAFAYATSSTTGHQHDGSAGQGGNIAKIGDQDFKNKVVISATNNRIEFYSEVSNSPVEQVRIQDGLITPVTDSDVDLGTTSVRFKNAFVDSVTVTNNIVVGGTVDGRDVATDGTKLDGVEASATADQTNAEIRTAVEAASDSNVFTDADHSKLNAIEASATADQTDAQIRAAVEAATDSNVFTDADHTKLNAIEASADVTDTANVTAAGALMDSEVTNLAQVKAFASSDYATAAQGVLAAAALPKSGGAMTGAITTNSTFDGVDIATRDGVLSSTTTTANAALPKAGGAMTGAITTNSTFDGRDVATDGTKLDGIESSATADQTAAEIRTLVEAASDSNVFTDADHSKLNALEASGDVTDTANVTAAGALMDSEVTNLAQVKAFDSSDYATAAQGTLATNALPKAGGAMTGAITTNSTFDGRDVATDGNKLDGIEASATADQTAAEIRAAVEAATNSNVFTDADHTKLNAIEASADVTDTANVTAAGALMDSELTSIASVKALNQGVATTNSPTFAAVTVAGRIKTTNGLFQADEGSQRLRQYEVSSGSGTQSFLLGKIKSSNSADGGVTGIVKAAYDYGTQVTNVNIHFTFAQRSGVNRGHWWYENTDDDPGGDVVSVKLIDDGSNNYYVWLHVGDYVQCCVEATWRQAPSSDITDSGSISASTITSGTTLFDTANDPTSEHHIGKLYAHNAVDVTGTVTADALDVNGTIEFNGLSGTGAVTVTNILDEDNMASNSATALATQQSIKAYVDANAGGDGGGETLQQTLAIGNTVTTDTKIQFRDTGLYINSSADGQLDIVADTEVQLAATTFDINAAVVTNGDVTVGDDLSLLSDSSKLNFGLNSDVSLTHQHNSGLLLNSTRKLYFNDTSQYIYGSDTTRLKMGATNEIELTAAVIDVNGNLDVSGNIIIAGTVDGVDIATRDGVLTTTTNTANAALPKAGGAMTGAITTNSTFDGRDVAADGVTADAALPKAGGAMTGAITTNSTFDGRDVAADGVTADAALPKAGGAMTGAITTNSTFDGVDIATRNGVLTTTTNTANAALPKAGGTMTGALTSGSNGTGHDVKFFGDTAGHYMLYDASTDNLNLVGVGSSLVVGGSLLTDAAGNFTDQGGSNFLAAITEDSDTLSGSGTVAINLNNATNWLHDLSGNTTYTFTYPTTSNAQVSSSFTLKIIQGSTARTITWPSSVDWAGGTAPTLSTANNAVDVFVFYTINSGTTWYGFTAGQAMA